MTYCFKCVVCGARREVPLRYAPTCCDTTMSRDWRSEGVGLGNIVEMKREREVGGPSAMRDLFLPTAKDFAGPDDPDGEKGIRDWCEKHAPRDGNKRPMYPEHSKRAF